MEGLMTTMSPSRSAPETRSVQELKMLLAYIGIETLSRIATSNVASHGGALDIEKSCQTYITKEHTDIINSIDGMGGATVNCGAPEIVTGSRDGTVKVWDPRQRGKPVANMQPVTGETKRDCWGVAFGNSYNDAERIVVAGYDNGDLKMFDLRTMSLRWECNLKNGVCHQSVAALHHSWTSATSGLRGLFLITCRQNFFVCEAPSGARPSAVADFADA
ncbi:WD repeat-containing protein 92 [Eumeta japonica]|uniref:WD repeat-containing protein 92 n=1 Tax=Eumeta variegata TaxID=151549 RepID=A0A4C1X8E1_EUMVA|nr:WD repeat-containing protein 92 [Eumeta japonica]